MDSPDSHYLIALWRRTDEGEAEFFLPFAGYANTLGFVVLIDGTPNTTARRIVESQFNFKPASNARIFRQLNGGVVAFKIEEGEAPHLYSGGEWLPARLITELAVAICLQDVAARL